MATSSATQETAEEDVQMSSQCQLVVSLVNRANGNLYEALGLKDTNEVTPEVVERAFRGLAPSVHPKSNPFVEAKEAFKILVQAFFVLSDPERKQKYDDLGQDGVDMSNMENMIDVTDILKHGQNLKNLPPLHRKMLEAEDDLYGVISGGKVKREEGRTMSHEEIMELFQETESSLQLGDDIEHIGTYSLCLNKLTVAYSLLSDPNLRRAYDTDEEEIEDPSPYKRVRIAIVIVLVALLIYLWVEAGSMSKPQDNYYSSTVSSGRRGKGSISADL
jgi:curved DNA-binding protein CbpA